MKTSEYPLWLAVPREARDAAREAAGLLPNGRSAIAWDKEEKLWFARPGCDLDRVNEWLPDRSIRAGGGDPESEFLDVLTQAGLIVKGMPVMDGNRQRVSTVDDKSGKKSGVYCGFLDRRPGGWFINYHKADNAKDVTNWVATGGEAAPGARLHIRAAAKQSQEDAARDRAETQAKQTLAAKTLYDRLPAADPSHPYLVRKGIPPTPEIRQTRNGALVVPFFNAQGIFKTLQYIPEAGEKLLFKDAPKQGHFLVVGGPLLPGQPIQYAEGYATARSLNVATGRPVVMTIDAGNMVAVAQVLHQQFPDSRHLFMADFDHAKDVNKGLLMANEAAALVGGEVVYPTFTDDEIAQGYTDFNDLHQSRGLEAVRDQTEHLFKRNDEVPTVQEQQSLEATNSPPGTPDVPLENGPTSTVDRTGDQPSAPAVSASVASPSTLEAPPVPVNLQLGPGPQQLNFSHNGQPASLNLQDYLPGQLPDATAIRPISPVAPPMPSFTFNGQPASLMPSPTSATPTPLTQGQDRAQESVAGDVSDAGKPTVPAATSESSTTQPVASAMLEVEAVSSNVSMDIASEVSPKAPSIEAVPKVQEGSTVAPATADTVIQPPANDEVGQQDVNPPSQKANVADPLVAGEDQSILPNKPDLAALLPRRAGAKKEADQSAEAASDFINVGARIGADEAPLKPSLIDKDALLIRITHETQKDNSVLYKLDDAPAFVDRGSRLEMVPGAGQSDEKIMAALLTAARFYRGQIELTGSDAFKAKAVELIAQHQVNVSMKNPAQQLMLDQARKALIVTAEKPDAVMGDTPPPFNPAAAPQASKAPSAQPQPVPSQSAGSTQPELQPVGSLSAEQTIPGHLIAPDPTDDNSYGGNMPLAVGSTDTAKIAPLASTSTQSVDPSIHQSSKAAKNGVTGKVMGFGTAPFRFEPTNQDSVYIKLRTKTGTQTFWGKELAGLLRQTRIEQGRMATLQWLGQNDVLVQAPVKDPATGNVIRFVEKEARRNEWSLSLVNGPVVRTGDDQGVKLAAYDAARFAMIQNSVMAQLNVPIEPPSLPRDGLFWMTPNGQGSDKSGDELSALRPAVDNQDAGKLIMSSWSSDGQLDLALYRGDGPYLQGVVRQGDAYQHVLVSLPGHKEAPPLVFNLITEQGLVPIGVGNGINRSGGESVSREHIAFKLEGDTTARIAKLDFPADVPPGLHHRLGFDERWKDTNFLPKSAPAAAPVAQPGAARPS